MHFPEYIQNTAGKISEEIDNILLIWGKEVEQETSLLKPAVDAFANACAGGKRIRGSLVVLAYELFGGSENQDIFKIAASYEIFQTSILAHDDIIDKSSLRRGKPSLHEALGGGHDGLSRSLCLGDIGFFLAFKIIADSDFPAERKSKALSMFSDAMLKTGTGELLDVELSINKDWKISLQDINSVNKLKTAYYTIASPMMLGALLAGAEETGTKMIKEFGLNLGISFQLKDDLNDIFSVKDKLGKEPGGDIREGKQTMLYFYAKDKAIDKQRKILEEYYGNPAITYNELEKVKEILISTGAVVALQKEVRTRIDQAKQQISEITKNKSYQTLLTEMTEYLT